MTMMAFLAACAVAIFFNRRRPLAERVETFAKGMGHVDIMLMCLIFILAGAFAAVAKGSGAVDSAVTIARALVPDRFMVAGVFAVAALISLAIGTSCGTIAATVPVALGCAEPLGISPALLAGAVVAGAMFGDNLSMISDTTIAATRTQGVAMRDKFWANAAYAIPAALVALVLYLVAGWVAAAPSVGAAATAAASVAPKDVVAVLPYVLILVLALAGFNVVALLFLGTGLAMVLGLLLGAFDGAGAVALAGQGVMGMGETMVVALLAGGLFRTIEAAGGLAKLTGWIARAVRGPKTCEAGMFALTGLINLLTANNTVAIVIAGPLARACGERFGADRVRLAGIIDTAGSVVQGMIPYGAQILIALGLARGAGMAFGAGALIARLYYPPILAVAVLAGIACARRRILKVGVCPQESSDRIERSDAPIL